MHSCVSIAVFCKIITIFLTFPLSTDAFCFCLFVAFVRVQVAGGRRLTSDAQPVRGGGQTGGAGTVQHLQTESFSLTVSESVRTRSFQRHLVVAGGGRERRGLCQQTLSVRAGREDAPDVLGEKAVLQTPQKVGCWGLRGRGGVALNTEGDSSFLLCVPTHHAGGTTLMSNCLHQRVLDHEQAA